MMALQSGVTLRQANSSEGKDTYRPAHYGASAVGVFCFLAGLGVSRPRRSHRTRDSPVGKSDERRMSEGTAKEERRNIRSRAKLT